MPRLPPSEAAHVEPGLLGMNMTMLFPSLPWETATLLQLGVQPGLNLPNPSSPHIRPAKGLLTHGLYNWARRHKHNVPSRATRIIKPGQMCLLEQKLVLQNSVQDLMEKEVMFLYKHLPESQFYLFTAIPWDLFTHSLILHTHKHQDACAQILVGSLVHDTKDKGH